MLRADAIYYDGSFSIEPLPVALADAVIDARLAFQLADRSVEIDGLSHRRRRSLNDRLSLFIEVSIFPIPASPAS
jgi:hypothetical protein